MRLVGRIQLGPEVANTVGVYGVVAVPERSRLYCSNLHTPWLTVIDTSARKFVGIVPLEEQEQRGLMEMARHPLSGRIYVSNEIKNCVYVVDPAKERLEHVVETGREPHYMDFDERTGRIFVCCGADNAVLVLSPEHRKIASVRVGAAPWGIAVDSRRRVLHAVCQGDGTLWRLHLDRLNPIAPPARLGAMPRCAAVDPLTGDVLVAHRRERRMLLFKWQSGESIASAGTEWDSIGITVDFRYRRYYVINRMGRLEEEIGQPATISVIDAEHMRTERHVPAGKIAHYLALDEDFAYVPNEDSLDVAVFDRARMTELGRIRDLGQTVDGMEIHPANGRIYVPSHLTDEVIVADPRAGRAIARPRVGSWPSGVAIDSRRGLVYCTNMDPGNVTVLRDTDHTHAAEIDLGAGTNKIHRLWSRVAVDEARRKVYVTLTRKNGLAIIDGASGRVERCVVLGEENPDVQSAYVRAFELALSVDASTGLVWVLNAHRSRLSAVDPMKGEVAASLDLGGLDLPVERRFSPFYALAADAPRKRIFVYNCIVSTETRGVTGRFPREAGTGVTAIDTGRNLIYAHGLRGLAVLDADSFAPVAFLKLEAAPGGEPSEVRTFYSVDVPRKRIYAVRDLMLHGNELEVYEAQG